MVDFGHLRLCDFLYLCVYCSISDREYPETNSIEEFFSELKHYIKKDNLNTYYDIYKLISNILEKKITKEHLTNYLKHSYKIYKSYLHFVSFFFLVGVI